jgi:hypothetical protein
MIGKQQNGRSRGIIKGFTSALAALFFVVSAVTPANAEVTFDSVAGKGFVGKGDVQLAFGWSNQTLQMNASLVDFKYNEQAKWAVTCEYTSENKNFSETRAHSQTITRNLNDKLAYSGRKNSSDMLTGYHLSFSEKLVTAGSTFEIPEVGQNCEQGNDTGQVTAVELISISKSLRVQFEDSGAVIWKVEE